MGEKVSPQVRVLNTLKTSSEPNKIAVGLSKDLQKTMLRMKGEFMSEDGSGVNYDALRESAVFADYKKQADELSAIDLSTLDEDEKKAFFINIYNALTIHGLIDCDTMPCSVLDVQQFWKNTAYNIGGHVFSLDDIEHGILRGNRPHPAADKPCFDEKDPRRKFIAKQVDPRIHFALVCGAKSCPSIQIFTGANIDRGLTAASKSFCEQEISVHIKLKELSLSKIFQWYRCDFGANEVEAIKWTLPYVCEDKQYGIETLLDMLETEGQVDIRYKDYDWRLNKQ
ncbi:unnamed protein product [Owenia fusiformis]|uniref:DUF547 domain-containing protein n=1 Tax=Owenia fusiformis TaxID=6347 RepID=A0A8S4P0K9_OWEFU|nr:unnamed protein product [Owenia fusiformis]